MTTVPIPERMRHLPIAPGGFPIPVIIQRDAQGRALFAVNDAVLSRKCVHKKLCPICGERLTKELWFVGGPRSAFDPHGMYFDSAMHHECMTYALQVCPHLAMPNYHSTSVARAPALSAAIGHGAMLADATMIPGCPDPIVAVMAYGQSLSPHGPLIYIAPLRPYHAVEFWRHGKRLDFRDGLAAVHRATSVPESSINEAIRLL